MSAICEKRWMRFHARTISPVCGLMSLDPLLIREKLFKGIDSEYNVVDMGIVCEVITDLENYNITKEALEATRLGKHINEVRRKSTDKFLANRAKSLVKKWRSLLSESGPPPGGGMGGENNNSVAATNGNTAALARISSDPSSLHHHHHHHNNHQRNNISPALRNNLSPGLRNNLSPGLRNNLSPGLRNNMSPAMRSNLSPAVGVLRPGSGIANSLPGGMRSARASPASRSRSTPRVSPTTVTLSSGESSPAGSRPTSPAQPFVPINPPVNSLPNSRSPSPDIEIVEEIVKAPPSAPPTPTAAMTATTTTTSVLPPASSKKRSRGSEDHDDEDIVDVEVESKRSRLSADSPVITAQQNGLDRTLRDSRDPGSDNNRTSKMTPAAAARKHGSTTPSIATAAVASPGGGNECDVLNAQISRAKRSGKVKTTKELIRNLGIDSGGVNLPARVSSLVPDENKEELMNRFFSSQSQIVHEVADDEVTEIQDEDDVIEVISRPGTGVEVLSRPGTRAGSVGTGPAPTVRSHTNSRVSSRVNTPGLPQAPKETVEDVLRLLEPLDSESILAEWQDRMESEEDIPGLIPVYRPKLEVTEEVIAELNGDNGALEFIGGVKDHTGDFKEWHEMLALERDKEKGELIHILPYSVID